MDSNERPDKHHSADPDDLHAESSESPGASTGLDRPFPAAGPVATPPEHADDDDLGLEDRPLG